MRGFETPSSFDGLTLEILRLFTTQNMKGITPMASFDDNIFALQNLVPAIHGGHGDDQGIVHLVENLLTAVNTERPNGFHVLGGIEALGANVHPLFVHFPIAFLLAYLVMETYGLLFKKPTARRFASGLLNLGGLSALVTVVTGLIAGGLAPHSAAVHSIIEWHQRAGITVTVIALSLILWRAFGGLPQSPMAITLNLLLSFLMGGLLLIGGDLGGQMVYQHGVAVKSLQSPTDNFHHEHAKPLVDHP
ncbi:MAG: DUF2231 domain-containing protein [Gammaproteobacteria bacterium]|nr:DUF2231 domain-containing protein [Gammaproteobacteria bacterium]NDE34249.1 DUF2231 domain-containing protein [Gammaproteobacteria bacterium]NDE56307.1 DUF2231 domain-containing protein [Gammaproteobacteria bacterium]NDG88291.1 DUF2231 domain-containing protein [Gammaproteobacteria bacterium]